jgi:hypothetical protein
MSNVSDGVIELYLQLARLIAPIELLPHEAGNDSPRAVCRLQRNSLTILTRSPPIQAMRIIKLIHEGRPRIG